jgi:competence protein ComEC
VLRAFLQLGLKRSNQTFNLSWRPFQIITASGLATLSFCRTENELRSLAMSWIASLALSVAGKSTQAHQSGKIDGESSWLTNLRVYVLMIPALLPLATPHPVSIAYNTLLAPIFGWVLFPLALIAFVFPPSATLVDLAWDGFYSILEIAGRFSPDGWARCEVPTLALCVYLAFLTVLLLRREHKELACA